MTDNYFSFIWNYIFHFKNSKPNKQMELSYLRKNMILTKSCKCIIYAQKNIKAFFNLFGSFFRKTPHENMKRKKAVLTDVKTA